MRPRWSAVALATVLIAGCGSDGSTVLVQESGAGSSQAATSPTAGDPPPSAPLYQQILHRARNYRGNPLWLGVFTGALLVFMLGLAVVTLRRG
jgi:hypothetical protein